MLQKDTAARRETHDLLLPDVKMTVAKAASGAFTFKGYGSVWNRTDSYGDTVMRGAFGESLKTKTPAMFFGHDSRQVPGKWLNFEEDSYGLLLEGELTPDHSLAKDLEASLRHGSISGLSIGGYTKAADWIEEDGQLVGRKINEFDLWEVSVVSMPAETAARIDAASVKAIMEDCDTLRAVERHLREKYGFTRGAAESLISRVKELGQGDPAEPAEAKVASQVLETIRGFKFPSSLLENSP